MSADADLDPSDFVRKIRELGEKRDQEDQDRVRALEEEIIQGRSERLARRAERARSISPEKSSAASTPRSFTPKLEKLPNERGQTPMTMPPSAQTTPRDGSDSPSKRRVELSDPSEQTATPAQPSAEEAQASAVKPAPSTGVPTRTGTLSWQQRRPPSSGGARRPLSMLASENAARSPRTPDNPNASAEPSMSRDQIAQSLGARDPSWFRQTADRGQGNAAYRKEREDTASESGSFGRSQRLPGMSRESTAEPEREASPAPESVRSTSPSRAGSAYGSVRDSGLSNRFSTNTSATTLSGRHSRPALDSIKFEPPSSDQASSTAGDEQSNFSVKMSTAQGRISPERTERHVSPTKGMGGFVQSAMLKRENSVNKRWSAQPGTGLSRQNSTASNTSGYGTLRGFGGLQGSSSMPKLEPSRPTSTLSRGNSMEPSSRPTSSHTITQSALDTPAESKDMTDDDVFAKPSLPHHSRSKSVHSSFSSPVKAEPEEKTDETTSPPSPSKRWSPTKSSWLESALSKPESPKPKMTPPVSQPSWMAEINKARMQRQSVDLGRDDALKALSANERKSPETPQTPFGPSMLKKAGDRPPSVVGTKPNISALRSDFDKPKPPEPSKPLQVLTKKQEPKLESVLAEQPRQEPEKPKVDEAKTTKSKVEEAKKAEPKTEESKIQDVKVEELKKPEKPVPPASDRKPSGTLAAKPSVKPNNESSTAKPKPDTPPKKDFRSTLRHRETPAEAESKGEPEFKNVFGKLRRTQTEKYVAPDMLKNNILRGKEGLTITGGPQKTERRDELKESLIAQKQAMKAKAEEEAKTEKPKAIVDKPAPATPEALAKRKALAQRDIARPTVTTEDKEPVAKTPEAIARQKSIKQKLTSEHHEKHPTAPGRLQQTNVSSKFADRFNPALASVLARGPPAVSGPSEAEPLTVKKTTTSSTANDNEDSGSTGQLTHLTKGRARGPKRRAPATKAEQPKEEPQPLAEPQEVKRIAAKPEPLPVIQLVKPKDILPSSTAAETSKVQSTPSVSTVRKQYGALSSTSNPVNRAVAAVKTETPRKVSDKAKPATPIKSPDLSARLSISDFKGGPTEESKPSPKSPPLIGKKPSISSIASIERVSTPQLKSAPSKDEREDKRSPSTSPTLAKKPLLFQQEKQPAPTSAPIEQRRLPSTPMKPAPLFSKKADAPQEPSTAPRTQDTPESDKENGNVSVRNVAALWGREIKSVSPEQPRVKEPIKLPTRHDEEAAMEQAGLRRSPSPDQKPVGLGLGLTLSQDNAPSHKVSASSNPSAPMNYPMSPPLTAGLSPSKPARTPVSFPEKRQSTVSVKVPPPESPIPRTSEASRLFADFFDDAPISESKLEVDTSAILVSKKGEQERIRTLRKDMHEVSGGGKMTLLPPNEEHILYESSMYLCSHTFGTAAGTKITEVYLWAGSTVSEPTVEDAQLFARRYAKDNNGTLLNVRQGKESANFFQALGRIVITRRGSRQDRSRQYMLCGRNHLGHIAFDEVELSLNSLCSGFCYIISSDSGRIYLWKGLGCNAEELSSALMISSDLRPTGEIERVDEGHEPRAFFDLFPSDSNSPRTIPRSADHWRIKPKYEKYGARLFRVEHNLSGKPSRPNTPRTPGSASDNLQVSSFWSAPVNMIRRLSNTDMEAKKQIVTEISPFTQTDIEPEGVYVLDAFFEIYIIVGPLATSSFPAFHTALLFAQEYGILAASMEDRPFIPVSTVVMEGVPRDMKAVFRRWDERYVSTGALMAGKARTGAGSGLGRGRSLRIVPLQAAIAATRRG